MAPADARTAHARRPAGEAERFAMVAAAQCLGIPEVDPDVDLWTLGLSEEGAAKLTQTLTEAGWGYLEPDVVRRRRTATNLARIRGSETSRAESVTILNAGGSDRPLFAVPGAGGTALSYVWLARALGHDWPIIVTEPQGLLSAGRAHFTVEAAAQPVVKAVLRHQPRGRIMLVAYSAGGMIAYEAAHRLVRRGVEVELVLLDCTIGPRYRDGDGERRISPGLRARRALVRTWLRILPARTVPTSVRHRAYFHLSVRSRLKYQPVPGPFRVTLLHPLDRDSRRDGRHTIPS